MDHLDAEHLREPRPFLAAPRRPGFDTGIGGDVEQRQRLEPHGVVGARFEGQAPVDVATRPRFDASIQIQRAALLRKTDQRDARHVHGKIQQEIAGAEQRLERLPVILAGQGGLYKPHAVMLGFAAALVLGGDDGDAIRRYADVPQYQRQDPLADAAEADEDDPAGKFHPQIRFAHVIFFSLGE